MNLREFIVEHENDDLAALVLQRDRWPDVDVALAAECIAARRKLRLKVPEWYADPALVCPVALSAEQCSSTATANYKSAIAGRLLAEPRRVEPGRRMHASACTAEDGTEPARQAMSVVREPRGFWGQSPHKRRTARIADLTGGLGVDSWQFSKVAIAVLYNEMNPLLFEAAKANLGRLGCDNVEFSNICISPETLPKLLDSFKPDLVFIDPARRAGGHKVFLPEDCSPDVLALQDIILERGCLLMLKLSPMADISLLLRKFHCVKELHVVEADGECKELLLVQEPGFEGECAVFVEIAGQAGAFCFRLSEEKAAAATFISENPASGQLLFEPGPALMKSGAFNLLSARFGLHKLGPSAHLYLSSTSSALEGLGKWFEIKEVAQLGKSTLRDFATRWPNAEVTARALPLNSDELRQKLSSFNVKKTSKATLAGSKHANTATPANTAKQIHLFGIGTTLGRLLIACRSL